MQSCMLLINQNSFHVAMVHEPRTIKFYMYMFEASKAITNEIIIRSIETYLLYQNVCDLYIEVFTPSLLGCKDQPVQIVCSPVSNYNIEKIKPFRNIDK